MATIDDKKQNGTIAYVKELPSCDIKRPGCTGTASYDFQMAVGSWAFGCESCWKRTRQYATLGIGKGQKLEVRK